MDDTAPIRPEERFDEERVVAELRRALPELAGNSEIVFDQFPGGAANLTYRAVVDNTELVLRRAPLGMLARGGHDMEREYRVLSRLWRVYPKAPRAFHFCEDPTVMGKPFFVMERRRGHVVREKWPASFGNDKTRRRLVCEGLVDALAELHLADADAVGLAGLGRPEGFVSRQMAGWSNRWEAARTQKFPEMDTLMKELSKRVPRPQTATILHNDFKLDNAMLSDDGELVAVFDWDMATRGDPLVDLGTLVAYWVDEKGPIRAIFGDRVQVLTPYMSRAEVIDRYATSTGFDVSEVRFHVALALYRIAVILEQIYIRFAKGQTSDDRFTAFESVAPLLAAEAWATLAGERDI